MDAPVQQRKATWQPLTPRGVAAFAYASLGRLLLTQLAVALVAAVCIACALHQAWFPAIEQAISQLPADGEIRSGVLHWQGPSPCKLGETRALSLAVDLNHSGAARSPSHVQVEFGRSDVKIISLLGYLQSGYPRLFIYAFNRTELQPWWGAWSPALLVAVVALVIPALLLAWATMALGYSGVVWLVGFFLSRDLPFWACWRLAGAALLPGAVFMGLAVLLYGFGVFDLLRLGVALGVHFVIGWGYLLLAPFRARYAPDAAPVKRNPFTAS